MVMVKKLNQWSVLAFLPILIFGYPVFVLPAYLFDLETVFFSYGYRLIVLSISLIIIKFNKVFERGRVANVIIFFVLFAYDVRLIFDFTVNGDFNLMHPLLFFNLVTVPVVLAAMASAEKIWIEIADVSRLLMYAAYFFVAILTFVYIYDLRSELLAFKIPKLTIQAFNPISATQLLCFSAVLSASQLTFSKKLHPLIWVKFVLFICFCIFFANTFGSAGPIFAMCCALTFCFDNVPRFKLITRSISLFVIFGIVYLTLSQFDFFRFARLDVLTDFVEKTSALERKELAFNALFEFQNSPIFGSGALIDSRGIGYNTHNFFLEVAISLGLVGLLPVGFVTFLVAKKVMCAVKKQNYHTLTIRNSFVFFGMCSMFSGGFWSSGLVFVFAIMVLAGPKLDRATERATFL